MPTTSGVLASTLDSCGYNSRGPSILLPKDMGRSLLLPVFSSVNPADAKAMEAYAHLLFSTYKYEGGFDNAISPAQFRQLRELSQKWIFATEQNIPGKKASEMQSYLSMYELIHSLAFSKTNSVNGFYDRHMGEAILKMAKGEKADKVGFMNWIQIRLRQDYRKISENQLGWYITVLSRWKEEFKVGINSFSRESNHETVGIVDFLLRNAFSDKSKGSPTMEMLIKSGVALTAKILESRYVHPRQLIDAASLAHTLFITDSQTEHLEKRKTILKRLSEHPDIHPCSREAYRLDALYEFPNDR